MLVVVSFLLALVGSLSDAALVRCNTFAQATSAPIAMLLRVCKSFAPRRNITPIHTGTRNIRAGNRQLWAHNSALWDLWLWLSFAGLCCPGAVATNRSQYRLHSHIQRHIHLHSGALRSSLIHSCSRYPSTLSHDSANFCHLT